MNTQTINSKAYDRLGISSQQLTQFCQKWKVAELALFGSILRDDFREDSDIDLLVSYQPNAKRGLFEKTTMKEELEIMLNRKVDLVSKQANLPPSSLSLDTPIAKNPSGTIALDFLGSSCSLRSSTYPLRKTNLGDRSK